MSKTRTVFTVIISVLIACTLAFIWGQSIAGREESANESQTVYNEIKPVLDAVFGKDEITHSDFRKMAHFFEFAVLGAEVSLLFITLGKRVIERVALYLPCGLITALIDETVQVVSERGASVVDVWIDFCGYLTATAFFIVVLLLKYLIKRQKNKGQ